MTSRIRWPSLPTAPCSVVAFLCLAMALPAVTVAAEPQVLAPGYHRLQFDTPPPGSYRLPPIGQAADGEVLDEHGGATRLHRVFDGRYIILSFIYSSCDDVNGCPLATYVLYRLYQAMQQDPELAAKMRLVSLSFDPQNDTPEVMRLYGASFAGDAAEWRFLTTAPDGSIEPILRDYGQSVSRVFDADGRQTGQISHVLRVFLIDPQRRVRNIYSVSFLHPDLVLADVRTLLMEAASDASERNDDSGLQAAPLRTRELLLQAAHPPLGLPPMRLPEDQQLTAARIDLGRKLFFDRRLSANGTLSCAMCHIPGQGFTNNAMARAVGMEGRSLRRNAASLYNLAWADPLHVDGRERYLDTLAWGEFLNRKRMGNTSVAMVLDKILARPDYRGLFETAFDGRPADMVTVGVAIASYLRAQVSANSPFDRWRFGGEEAALTPAAQRGYALFSGRAGCADCHRVETDHALFSDGRLHDTGIGWYHSMGRKPKPRFIELASGVRIELDLEALEGTEERPFNDLGLYEVTQDPADRWKFRTPSLRNVALTAPYMHDGSLRSLDAVIDYYDSGGHAHAGIDPRIRPLGLTAAERADLEAFLDSLTGDNIALLAADAAAAPVGVPAGKDGEP
jgi:cytochrome c peroxidase